MYGKFFNALMVVVLVLALPASIGLAQSVPEEGAPPRPIGSLHPAGIHKVAPREEVVINALTEQGVLAPDASQEEVEAAVVAYYEDFNKHSSQWVNPEVQMAAYNREMALSNGLSPQADPEPEKVSVKIFALAADFNPPAAESISYSYWNGAACATVPAADYTGPLHGQTVNPAGTRDNNTIWYSPAQIDDLSVYYDLIFGYQGAGRVRTDLPDPNDGQPGINLAGYTVQDYYDHFAGVGNVSLEGVVEGWVAIPHSEAYYGAPWCAGSSAYDSDGGGGAYFVGDVVIDAVKAFQAQNPTYYNDTSAQAYWKQFDGNQDGWLDTFWLIHSGAGEEAGGGAQGQTALWSHSWTLEVAYAGGFQVYEGDPATDADDIHIGPYTIQPEHADLGVFVEEFGHNFFGLPDLYTTDAQNSVGFWSEMSGGSWGGYLGGSVPVGMPLWFKQVATCGEGPTGLIPCNWQYPMVTRDYTDPLADIVLGQIDGFPGGDGVMKGVQINLPSAVIDTANESGGTGKAAWTGTRVNDINQSLVRTITVPAASPVLSMQTYWEIEEGCLCDFAFVEIKGPSDTDYITLQDTGDHFTEISAGFFGLHNWAPEPVALSFDLTQWAGQTVSLRLRYQTDPGYTDRGWWVDDLALNGVVFETFETAAAPTTYPSAWTTAPAGAWKVTPMSLEIPKFYLLEWRSDSKYDEMLQTAYVTTYNDADEWQVERVPYNIPAALLYYRDDTYPEGYSQRPNYFDEPSFGPKNKLLVVDMNNGGMRLFDNTGTYIGVLNARASSYDAGLTLQESKPFYISNVFGVPTPGPFNFVSKPAVSSFNDALGYYPGFFFGSPCLAGLICYTNRDGSAVIPARDVYSTRITDFPGNPLHSLYGAMLAPALPLGSGNPGDDMVQYGVNIELLDKAENNETAVVRVYNYSVDAATESAILRLGSTSYDIVYTTILENVGTETATDLRMTYTLDSGLAFVSFESSALVTMSESIDPQGMVKVFNVPTLGPGQRMTITLTARYTGAVPFNVSTSWAMHDGQIARGPWLETTALAQEYLYRFPSIYH